ncbi:DUF5313 family protein [Gordonia otitidis]|uniref:DUF5313 domain-containing protein n=1 Tax=Gordonia otitidis (strain DSM 44809 / CCUG 52243 / JCM 12355 / NBRC 100426 / IFM 10032) TaxID=1108044 RepID=H5TKI2_GORO1|nr:DUF5313 family protein [Gordonia otitidis]GAB33990.1 hypothetical protein GOOTI_090_00200 [Gordonia otitidis NBRC 100426]
MADTAARPRGWQYLRYCYGAVLPVSMRDWVANDLAGKGAPLRMVVRWAIPCIILMLPMLFVPADWGVRFIMFSPIPIAYVFFSIALNVIYRRHRLEQHGLNPDLVKRNERVRNADLYDEYHRKYRGSAR